MDPSGGPTLMLRGCKFELFNYFCDPMLFVGCQLTTQV